MSAAARVLRDAADLIESGGHCKRKFWDAAGRHCAIGAIYVTANNGDESATIRAARDLLADAVGGDPYGWNDAPERSADEVVVKLRQVALEAA